MSEDNFEIQIVNQEVIEAQNKAEIDSQIATAKKYPRDITRSKQNAITIATMDEDTAKSCGYAVPRAGKTISGPSVHLAKIIVQQWGNLRVDTKVVAVDAKTITSQSVCHDLENNVAIRVEVKKSIMGKQGRFSEDMIIVTGNAANSIAMRNAVFTVIPKSVTDAIYKAAQEKIVGDISDETKFITKRAQVFAGFKDTYGISEERVLQAIGLKAMGQVKGEHLKELIGIAQGIKDGDTTVDEAFPSTTKEVIKDKADGALKNAADSIKKNLL
jgi:hypothetical protein